MTYFVGLDVSMHETAVCVVDDVGGVIRELVESFPRLAPIVEPLLTVRQVMRWQLATLHKMLLNMVRDDPVW